MLNSINHIFFIGIGGISMSGLAEIMLDRGFKVSGSDMNNSKLIEKLKDKGANIYIGHNKDNIDNPDLIVYTSAINENNPEFVKGKELGIKLLSRAEFLGNLMNSYTEAIAISGTHGKTTTTGMVSSILINTDFDPTISIGGELSLIGGNIRIGDTKCLLTEACEYKRNFLNFNPTIGVVLNIDEDHLDYYKDIKDIELAFNQFGNRIPSQGTLIVNNENLSIFNNLQCNVISFGLDKNSDVRATNIKYTPYPTYTLVYKNEEIIDIELSVFGMHNILNSLSAAAVCILLNIDPLKIKEGLKSFIGTKRRYQIIGNYNSALLVDDYAHHPTEIKATLSTAKNHTSGKIITIFQPHTYTRTHSLLDDFSKAFGLSDIVIVVDIYAAREKDTGLIHSKDLVGKIKKLGINATYATNFQDAANIVKKDICDDDTIITMGAGDVYKIMDFFK